MSVAGKVVLITGSTTGIGEACARLFAQSGSEVMVSGRNRERGVAVAESIKGGGGIAQFCAADLHTREECERLVAETVNRLGRLDILVNNAGVLYRGDAPGTTDQHWLDTMAVNVNAVFYMSRAAVLHMQKNGGGAIINVASEWGQSGEAKYLAYCASKGAVLQITRCMALDHARDNIRVNSVCPGEVHTQRIDALLATRGDEPALGLKELAAGIPQRRLAQPNEVAHCVRFLASDQASYVTGASLNVDGGSSATAGAYP